MNDLSKYEEFSAHLQEHYSPLYGYILSLVHNPDDADDVFQQTALTLWRKYDEFRPDSPFRAWACGVARFNVLTFLRTKRRDRVHFSDEAIEQISQWQVAAPAGQQSRRQEALQFCLKRLTDVQRDLLRRYYELRENAREIASTLGRSTHSVHSSLTHIRSKLHDCIEWRLRDGNFDEPEEVQ